MRLFLLTFLTAFTVCAAASMALAQVAIPDFAFVVSQGHAKETVKPDMATLSLSVEAHAPSSKEAEGKVAKTTREILDVLAEFKVKKKAIEASDIRKHPQRRSFNNNGRGQPSHFAVSRSMTVQLESLKDYSTLAKRLVQIDHVSNIRSQFDSSNRLEIEAKLLTKAMKDARKSADTMASALGGAVDKVHAISQNSDFKQYMARFGVRDGVIFGQSRGFAAKSLSLESASHNAPDTPFFAPDKLDIERSVNTVFRLK